MTYAIDFLLEYMSYIIYTLDSCVFDFFGVDVTLWGVIFAFICVSIVANVWWKGAKG